MDRGKRTLGAWAIEVEEWVKNNEDFTQGLAQMGPGFIDLTGNIRR